VLFSVYETHYEGEEMPESWWRPRRVIGELVFDVDRVGRMTFDTAEVIGPDYKPLLARMDHARVTERKNGRLIIDGEQKPAHVKGLYWQKRSYTQQWLCIPRPT
jgi:hypothetical protein